MNDRSSLYISLLWLFALLNPLFKKYDYGAGFPLVIVLIVLLGVILIREFRYKGERDWYTFGGLLFFVLMVSVSFILSETRNLGLSEMMAFASALPLFAIFSVKKAQWVDDFLKVVAAGTILAVLMGFILYFFWNEPRMVGPFFNILYHANKWPNAFALFLLMGWPLCLLVFDNKERVWKFLAISLVLSALFLTFSRGAFIAFCGQIVLLLIYFWRELSFKKIVMALLSFVLALTIFFSATYVRSLNESTVDLGDKISFDNGEALTSGQERMDFWRGALELIKEKPLFGYGPFSFRYAYNPIQKTFLGNSDHPHNLFLKIGVENGLLALAGFLFFLLALLMRVWRRFPVLSKIRKDRVYVLGVAAAGALAHSLIDYNFNFLANLMLFFMILAAIFALTAGTKAKLQIQLIPLLITLPLAVMAVFEGALLTLSYVKDDSYLSYSNYPRGFYVAAAEEALRQNDFANAKDLLARQTKLNPLDAQAYYLRGTVACKEGDIVTCKSDLFEAIRLNPLNDISYYTEYVRLLVPVNMTEGEILMTQKAAALLEDYFWYVENNVHFTAYTKNVEAAYDLAYLLLPFSREAAMLEEKAEVMMEKAQQLRAERDFIAPLSF